MATNVWWPYPYSTSDTRRGASLGLGRRNFDVDGPSNSGRSCQVRFRKKTVVFRLHYHKYPGTGGEPRLHGHIGSGGGHIPLDPRSFWDDPVP